MSDVVENVGNKAFYVNKKLKEIRGLLEEYHTYDDFEDQDTFRSISVKIVGALTEVMKVADYKMSGRICEVIDDARRDIWVFAGKGENAGEPLMSLLKELTLKNLSLR